MSRTARKLTVWAVAATSALGLIVALLAANGYWVGLAITLGSLSVTASSVIRAGYHQGRIDATQDHATWLDELHGETR